jgi:PAS domain S-box-containing protein
MPPPDAAAEGTGDRRRSRTWRTRGGRGLLVGPLVESDLIAAIIWDENGIEQANDAFLEMVGYTRKDLDAGRLRWREMTPPEHRDRADRALRELRETGRAIPFENEYVRKDGIRVPVLVGFARVRSQPFRAVGYVIDLSEQSAGETERARLLELEHEARGDAERARDRLAFLAQTGQILFGSLDYEDTLARVARLAVPRLADWCSVDVVDRDGEIRQLALAHVDPDKVEAARQLRNDYPPEPAAGAGVPAVIRTGRSEFYPDISQDMLHDAALEHPELGALLGELALRSAMIVPLTVRGRTLGAITFVISGSGRRYTEEDLTLAESLADRAALAIENARLYRERSSVAETLQRSLLPPTLPEIEGFELGAAYRPADEGSQVGGDFYDAFHLGDADWFLAIGDVCGKGALAAVETALSRYTIRTAALSETRPSKILETLNEAVLRQEEADRFITACCVRLHVDRFSARATVSSGGHPLPLLLRPDGALATIGRPGTLLGTFADPSLTDAWVDLVPGDAIVLYTDGVTEEASGKETFGEMRFGQVLTQIAGLAAQEMADRLIHAVLEFRDGAPRDDMAVLVMKMTNSDHQTS